MQVVCRKVNLTDDCHLSEKIKQAPGKVQLPVPLLYHLFKKYCAANVNQSTNSRLCNLEEGQNEPFSGNYQQAAQ